MPTPTLLARCVAVEGAHGYRPAIDILEPDSAVLVAWLHEVRPADLFRGPRVSVFPGPDAEADYEAFRVAHLARPEPTHVLRCPRPGWTPPPAAPLLERVRTAVARRRRELLATQARVQAAGDPADRFARFARGDTSLRVVGFTTRYSTVIQYVMRDLADAFRRAGAAFELVQEPDETSGDVDAWSTLAPSTPARQPCDLVVLINVLKGQLADRFDSSVPCVSWIQDHVATLATEAAGALVGPRDRVLVARPWTLESRYGYPAARLIATSNLTGSHHASPEPPDRALTCDVSYVSHASAPVERFVAELAQPHGEAFRAFLDDLVRRLRVVLRATGRIPFAARLEAMREAEAGTPGVRLTPAERANAVFPVAECLCDRLLRHETLEWAARWAVSGGRTLRLYGHGWETHPTLGRFAGGVIEHGAPLRALARSSAINLQVNGYASLHPRLLDAVACGGFVLTRFNPNDFIREPMETLGRFVREQGIDSLDALLDRGRVCPEAAALLDEHARISLFRIAVAGDAARCHETRLLREVFALPAEQCSDDALFDTIRAARGAPRRVAADLPGFAGTVFADEASMHALLDRFVDDVAAREAIVTPMRAAVVEHDTYDVLVRRIVRSFTDG